MAPHQDALGANFIYAFYRGSSKKSAARRCAAEPFDGSAGFVLENSEHAGCAGVTRAVTAAPSLQQRARMCLFGRSIVTPCVRGCQDTYLSETRFHDRP